MYVTTWRYYESNYGISITDILEIPQFTPEAYIQIQVHVLNSLNF